MRQTACDVTDGGCFSSFRPRAGAAGGRAGGPGGGAQVLELLAYFTYCTPAITPRLWSLWEPMAACLNEWAVDFFESVLVALDNFISRGTDTFLACKQPDYLASANHVPPRPLPRPRCSPSSCMMIMMMTMTLQ